MGTVNPDARVHAALHLPREGDLLAGKYRVEKVIGVGGMGVVVAAAHVDLLQRVAVKVMLPDLAQKPEFAARFLREAQATASLHSDHVTRVFDVGRFENGAPYMVMELLEGDDLDKLVRRRGALPIEEAVGYMLEACEAVAEAHRIGIIHRDLKPSNLFLAQQPAGPPVLKLLDFGISKSTKLDPGEEGLTATESTLGSPQYMSPEQLRSSKRVDTRTDLWSLGMILHRLLTGRVAFEADSIGGQLAMLIAEPPTPLRKRRPDAPAELEAAILRCLQKDVGRRFQNAGQLAYALAPFSPAKAGVIVPRIVAILGEAAMSIPLPPMEQDAEATPFPAPPSMGAPALGPASMGAASMSPASMGLPPMAPAPVAETATASTWTPEVRATPSRTPLVLGLTAAAAVVAVVAGALLFLGGGSKDAAGDPAASAAAAAPSAPAIAAPTEVTIRLTIDPSDATAEIDGAKVAGGSMRLPKDDRVHKLVVTAPGYATESRDISAQADTIMTLSLKAQPEKQSPKGVRPGKAGAGAPASTGEPTGGKKLKGPMETSL